MPRCRISPSTRLRPTRCARGPAGQPRRAQARRRVAVSLHGYAADLCSRMHRNGIAGWVPVVLRDQFRQQLRRRVRVERLAERSTEYKVRFGPVRLDHESLFGLPNPCVQRTHRRRVDGDSRPPGALAHANDPLPSTTEAEPVITTDPPDSACPCCAAGGRAAISSGVALCERRRFRL